VAVAVAEAYGIRPARRLAALDTLQWPVLVLVAAAATAALTLYSLQAAIAGVCVFGILALHTADRAAGVVAMLAFWLVAPGLRRFVQFKTGYVNADPLSLAPFLLTGGIVMLELARSALPPRVIWIVLCAAAGFAIGFPVGLQASPPAAIYALGGYVAAIGVAIVGFNEAREGREESVGPTVRFLLPLIATYAIVQGIVALPAWDQAWLDAVKIRSIGVPGVEGAVRVFGTLNAPATLAGLLAIGLLWHLAARRPGAAAALASGLMVVALALTYVRAAWGALIVAAIAHVLLTRGRSFPRAAAAAAVTVLAIAVLAGANASARSLVDRVSTFGQLSSDTSTQERVATPTQILATAVTAPLGEGLGQVGEASRLAPPPPQLRHSDNAYLALVVSSGPIGFVLVIGAIATVLAAAWRLARRESPVQAQATRCAAILVFVLVFMVSGDHLYGAVGVVFWLVAGYVLGLEHRLRSQPRSLPAANPLGGTIR
jgi:hypothetical protein